LQAPLILPDYRPPSNWPAEGSVEFIDYSTRYRDGLDLVIKGVNCHINGGEKVKVYMLAEYETVFV
jgi:hypothetical protein